MNINKVAVTIGALSLLEKALLLAPDKTHFARLTNALQDSSAITCAPPP